MLSNFASFRQPYSTGLTDFFFLLKAGVKLRLLHDESFTGKMTKIFIIFLYLEYPNPAA